MNGFQKSNEMLVRAKKVTPLGAQTYSKSYRYYCEGNSPTFIECGKGSRVWDIDGNEYIDFVCALGPITIGYNDERINRGIQEQLEKGIIFSQPAPITVELAEKLIEIIPCAEMVRFVKNGSDATTAAIRLARAFTRRDMVLVCGYHGMQDWYIGATENNRGVPKIVGNLTETFIYNDLNSLEKQFERYKDKIAAVILEPIQGQGPEEGFLKQVKELTHKNGALLIFDEVVSGFRYALGGASEYCKVIPDMAAIGKGMGNGMPISAVVGRRDVLSLIEEGVFVSTTFGGEALSLAASLATIQILESEGAYEHVWHLGRLMKNGILELISKHDVFDAVEFYGLEPHCGVIFKDFRDLDYLDINSVFQQTMIENGILTVGVNNLNQSHTETDIKLYLKALDKAFGEIRQAMDQNAIESILKGGKVNPIFKRNKKTK